MTRSMRMSALVVAIAFTLATILPAQTASASSITLGPSQSAKAEVTPTASTAVGDDCEVLCWVVVGIFVIGSFWLGAKAIDAINAADKRRARLEALRILVDAGITKSDATSIIDSVGGTIKSDSQLEQAIDSKLSNSKGVTAKSVVKDIIAIDGIEITGDHLSQLLPGPLGSGPAQASTSGDVSASSTFGFSSTSMQPSPEDAAAIAAIRANPFRTVDLAPLFGPTGFQLLLQTTSTFTVDFNTDLDAAFKEGSGHARQQFQLGVSGAGVDHLMTLFEGGLTTSSDQGLFLTGDLAGVIANRPPSAKDTIEFSRLYSIIVDNVDPSWTYTFSVQSHIDTQVSASDVDPVPEPSTLLLMLAGLAAGSRFRRARRSQRRSTVGADRSLS